MHRVKQAIVVGVAVADDDGSLCRAGPQKRTIISSDAPGLGGETACDAGRHAHRYNAAVTASHPKRS